MSSKIVFVTTFPAAADFARELVPTGYELIITEARSAEYNAALATAEYLVGFVDMLVDAELYAAAPNLKLIQLLSAGYDRADIPAAQKAGVPISNNGGANSVAVSEHALLLMLATSRQLVRQHGDVAAGRWRGNNVLELHELRNRSLGIIGLGAIGKKTARLAQAFGMAVTYYDIQRLSEAEEDALSVRFRLLRELLAESDLVSLHVPLNPSTQAMIGAAELALMKPTATLINTSRGPVIDEVALHDALSNNSIAGAGLDVFDVEPPAPENPLFGLDNVTLTPHIGTAARETREEIAMYAAKNIQRFLAGERPLNVFNPEVYGETAIKSEQIG